MPRDERRLIFGLFLLAFAVRCLLWAGTYTIGADSTAFLRMAELIRDGQWNSALKTHYHPGLPALIAFTSLFTFDNLVFAGFAISILVSSLGVIPLYLLAKEIFGKPAAIVAAILYSMQSHLVDVQADIMTEGAYIGLFIAGLWMGWQVISKQKLAWAMPAGVCAAGCYLFRNEGLLLVAGLTAWFLFEAARRRRLSLVAAAPILLGTFVILAIPFLLWVRQEMGHWAFTAKGSGVFLQRMASGDMPGVTADPITMRTVMLFVKLNFYVLLIPLAAGLCLGWKDRVWPRLFLLSFAVVYYAGVFYNIHHVGYTSVRYLIPGLCLLMAFTGSGLVMMPKKCTAIAVLILALVIGGRTFAVNRWDFMSVKTAGEWLAKNSTNRPRVFSTIDKIGWYGHAEIIGWPHIPETIDDLAANADFVMCSKGDTVPPYLPKVASDARFEAVQADFVQGRKGQRDVVLFKVRR